MLSYRSGRSRGGLGEGGLLEPPLRQFISFSWRILGKINVKLGNVNKLNPPLQILTPYQEILDPLLCRD